MKAARFNFWYDFHLNFLFFLFLKMFKNKGNYAGKIEILVP